MKRFVENELQDNLFPFKHTITHQKSPPIIQWSPNGPSSTHLFPERIKGTRPPPPPMMTVPMCQTVFFLSGIHRSGDVKNSFDFPVSLGFLTPLCLHLPLSPCSISCRGSIPWRGGGDRSNAQTNWTVVMASFGWSKDGEMGVLMVKVGKWDMFWCTGHQPLKMCIYMRAEPEPHTSLEFSWLGHDFDHRTNVLRIISFKRFQCGILPNTRGFLGSDWIGFVWALKLLFLFMNLRPWQMTAYDLRLVRGW